LRNCAQIKNPGTQGSSIIGFMPGPDKNYLDFVFSKEKQNNASALTYPFLSLRISVCGNKDATRAKPTGKMNPAPQGFNTK